MRSTIGTLRRNAFAIGMRLDHQRKRRSGIHRDDTHLVADTTGDPNS